MAYSDYNYDSTANSADNFIENEVQTVSPLTRVIWTLQGPFYQKDFVVEAREEPTDTYRELKLNSGYILSPLFSKVSGNSGVLAYSYIVLTEDLSKYHDVRLTYRAVGGFEDSALIDLIPTVVTDPTSIREWLKVNQYYRVKAPVTDLDLGRKQPSSAIVSALQQLQQLLESMETGSSTVTEAALTEIESTINGIADSVAEMEPIVKALSGLTDFTADPKLFGRDIVTNFVGTVTTSASPPYRATHLTTYKSYQIWLETPSVDDIVITVEVDDSQIQSITLPAAAKTVAGNFDVPFDCSFDNEVKVLTTVITADGTNMKVRLSPNTNEQLTGV